MPPAWRVFVIRRASEAHLGACPSSAGQTWAGMGRTGRGSNLRSDPSGGDAVFIQSSLPPVARPNTLEHLPGPEGRTGYPLMKTSVFGWNPASSFGGYMGWGQTVWPGDFKFALVAPGASTLKFASTQSSKTAFRSAATSRFSSGNPSGQALSGRTARDRQGSPRNWSQPASGYRI